MASGVWGMDVIFCRNVLIYFDADTITSVAESLMAALAEGGWIILGATDPPLNEYIACSVVQTKSGLVYRHPGVSSRRLPRPAPPVQAVPPAPVLSPPSVSAVATSGIAPAIDAVGSEPAADARRAYGQRDYERAMAMIAPLAAARRATLDDLIVYIRALANVGRLEEAGRVCAFALDQFRDNAELHYLHAVLVAQSGHHAESVRAAKRALYLDRDMTVAHLALGSALFRAGDVSGARRAFDSAERTLKSLLPEAVVPFSDGEPAGRLLEMTRVQSRLARGDAA
jgi:chemotaxis protein methyltransferase CheR